MHVNLYIIVVETLSGAVLIEMRVMSLAELVLKLGERPKWEGIRNILGLFGPAGALKLLF